MWLISARDLVFRRRRFVVAVLVTACRTIPSRGRGRVRGVVVRAVIASGAVSGPKFGRYEQLFRIAAGGITALAIGEVCARDGSVEHSLASSFPDLLQVGLECVHSRMKSKTRALARRLLL